MAGPKRESALIAGAFAAAAVILTLPLARDLTRTLPSDLTDTLLNTWTIAWDADRLRHGLAGVWDAPIFFPYHDTLAFSETLLGLAPLVAPVYWLTRDPVLTYNVAFLLSFVIAGIGMYLLAREITGSRAGAFAAGIYYAFGPFRMAQIAHVQMMAAGWMPIALWGLHRYFTTRRPRWLLAFAGAWVLQALSNAYLGYFLALPAAVIVVDGLWRARGSRARVAAHLAAAAVLTAVALSPVAAAYYRARTHNQQTRSAAEITALSADVRSYVVGKNTIGVWRWLPTAVVTDPERELFPGIFAIVLAGVGIWTARRDPRLKHWSRIYALIAAAALVLSLGPVVRVWGTVITTHGPYAWLLRTIPGMDGMRVPARFAAVFVCGLAVLIACGVSGIVAMGAAAPSIVLTASVALILADGWAVPIPLVHYSARGRAEDRLAASWLADRGPGAVVHFPLQPAAFQDLHYQFMTLTHHRPIVNGYSGYGTALLAFLGSGSSPLADVDHFPAAVRMLQSLGVRYVIVHPGDFDARAQAAGVPDRLIAAFRSSGLIAKEAGLPGVTAFELGAESGRTADEASALIPSRELTASASESPDRIPNLFDGDRDTRWIAGIGGQDGSSWVRIQLAHPEDLARVEILIAERSIGDYPRVLRIDSEDPQGRSRVLYDDAPYPELAAAIVADGRYPSIGIRLPHNRTSVLWLRQTVPSRFSWSIHELRVWRYDASGGSR